jgi:hypothetical protein
MNWLNKRELINLKPLTTIFLLILGGCSFNDYSSPGTGSANQYERVLDMEKEKVWEALIEHASRKLFGITNFEKSSGLMTVSFGSAEPSRYVDCGEWQGFGIWPWKEPRQPYVDYITRNGGRLEGNMNISIRALGPSKTLVRVNAYYVVQHLVVMWPGTFMEKRFNHTWSFRSGGSSTYKITFGSEGMLDRTRTCRSTNNAELSLLNALAASQAQSP